MTLEETVHQKVASWRPTAEGRQSLAVFHEPSGWRVRITADRQENLGCALSSLSLERSTSGGTKGLRDWAERISTRVTGLLEPLKLIELDAERNQALLRSSEPSRRNDETFYYEVVLKGDREALVRRYRAAVPGDRREQIAFTLTHEALAKLTADLAGD
jgi:hypothetical protein